MAGTYALVSGSITIQSGDETTGIGEFTAYPDAATIQYQDGDLFYRDVSSVTVQAGRRVPQGPDSSIVFDNGAAITATAGYVVTIVTNNLLVSSGVEEINNTTTGNGSAGIQIGVGSALNSVHTYRVDGRDVGGVGGWKWYLVDLRNLPTGPDNTTSLTNPRYFGITYSQSTTTRREQLLPLNGVRYGRMGIDITGGTVDTTTVGDLTSSASNFLQLAEFNSWNEGTNVTIPGSITIGTAVDGGYHEFGIFDNDNLPGGFLQRGLINFGTSSAPTYFQDKNKQIAISDEFLTYDGFNGYVVDFATTTVELTNCVFNFAENSAVRDISSTLTPATPRGTWTTTSADPTVTLTGCSFNDMSTFVFQSNTTLNDTTLRRCGQATQNGATITDSTFEECREDISLLVDATSFEADIEKITNTGFTSDGTNHAIAFDAAVSPSSDVTVSLDGITFTGYSASSALNTNITGTAADANAAISLVHNGTGTIFFDVLNGGTVPSIENTGTGNVQIRETFQLDVTGLLGNTEVRIYENPSLFTGAGSSTDVAGVETVAAVTQTNTGTNYIFYSVDLTPNVTQIQRTGAGVDFTTIGLVSGDKIRVTVRDNADNPTLQLFDEFEVDGTVTSSIIPIVDVAASSTNFSDILDGINTKIVTIEKVNATETFSVGSGTYDIFVYRIGSLPIITKAFEVASNSRIPISQAGDRVYNNPV
jgi:hypothetical protein